MNKKYNNQKQKNNTNKIKKPINKINNRNL